MTIPADIREKAEKVFVEWVNLPDEETLVDGEQLRGLIARAIMAERERCAQIAESRRSLPSHDVDEYGTSLATAIASAIRNEGEQKT